MGSFRPGFAATLAVFMLRCESTVSHPVAPVVLVSFILLLITGCQHKPVSPAVDILPIATPVVEKPYDGNYPDLIFDAGEENENRGWQKEPCIDNSNTICGHKAVTRDADIPDIHNMYNRGIVR